MSAGQKVILQSGGDTLIQGDIKARQIQGQARNLTVESLQDTDYQQGQQQQLGVSLTAGANSISGSINLNNNHYRSDYASVQQRAGLESADGGIQYRVEKNLHLSGAGMAGNEEAVKRDRIQIVAGTVTQKAIKNRDDNNASSVGLGIGFSQSKNQPQTGVGKNQLGQATTGALQVPGSQFPSQHGLSATMPVVMNTGHSASSTTYSGISNAAQAVTITNPVGQLALTGQPPEQAIAALEGSVISDQNGSNPLKPIFNQSEIEAGFQIVGALTREVGIFLENRTRTVTEAQQALKQEQAKPIDQQDPQHIQQLQQTLHDNRHWEMGGNGRLLMNAFTLASGGNVTGSAGQLLQGTVVNVLQGLGARQVKLLADSLNSETARAALQGLLAGAGAVAQGENAIPAALGASGSVVLNNLFEAAYGENSQDLTLDERQARRNLVTSIISGTTQALGGDAVLANLAATLETENNSAAAATLGGLAVAAEPVITGAALLGGGAAAATVGVVGGAIYSVKETVQDREDALAILAGRKTLAQVIDERGPRSGQRVELLAMYEQLPIQKLIAEGLYDNDSVPFGTYTPSKQLIEKWGKKYLPNGFRDLSQTTYVTSGASQTAPQHQSASSSSCNDITNRPPNVGKDLAKADKAEIGSNTAPFPGGWGPEDEERKRCNEALQRESAQKLNAKLAAEEIANGHAFKKHVLESREFENLGIKTKEQFQQHIENVVRNPSAIRYYKDGRIAYLHEKTKTVVIRNPNGEGTCFQPKAWDKYLLDLPIKTTPRL